MNRPRQWSERTSMALMFGRLLTLVAGWLAGLAANSTLQAQPVTEFYAGKNITLLVGAGPGGSYDIYARVLARHLPRHIPGQPTIVVKLAGGVGGGIATAIALHSTVPKDGTVIGMTQQTNIVSQLTEPAVA